MLGGGCSEMIMAQAISELAAKTPGKNKFSRIRGNSSFIVLFKKRHDSCQGICLV